MVLLKNEIEYEIKCNSKYSWSYIYVEKGKSREIWAESIANLKKKVLDRDLPWNDEKVPKTREFPMHLYKDYIPNEDDCRPTNWWIKSIYKQYNNH